MSQKKSFILPRNASLSKHYETPCGHNQSSFQFSFSLFSIAGLTSSSSIFKFSPPRMVTGPVAHVRSSRETSRVCIWAHRNFWNYFILFALRDELLEETEMIVLIILIFSFRWKHKLRIALLRTLCFTNRHTTLGQ